MHLMFIILVGGLATAAAGRESGFTVNNHALNSPGGSVPEIPPFMFQFRMCHSLLPSLNTIPCLHICSNRRLLPIPKTRTDFNTSLLLLLAGDVSLNPGPLRVGTVNTRSYRDKAPVVSDLVVSRSIGVLGITETWLTTNETDAALADLTPPGFSLCQKPRSGRRGGGVALLAALHLQFSEIPLPSMNSLEAIFGKVYTGKDVVHILNIYRPPGKTDAFFGQFQDILSHAATLAKHLVVMGDFNLHVDVDSSDSRQFLDMLKSFDLRQHVDFPTHIHGHSLDLIMSSSRCDVLSVSAADQVSDHFTVVADLDMHSASRTANSKEITFRNLKTIDMTAFKDDIQASDLLKNPCQSADTLSGQYEKTLTSLLDKHAPLKTRKVVPKPPNPWMTSEIQAAKRHRRFLEREWRKNPTLYNRSRLTRQTRHCNRMMSKAKSACYSDMIKTSSSDPKSLWRTFNTILHRCAPTKLPSYTSISSLAEKFGNFFVDKITIIRSSFPAAGEAEVCDSPFVSRTLLQGFTPATEEEVRRLVLSSPTKSSDLDPIPTSLLKSCIDVLVKPITSIVNMSLKEGNFPSAFKTAHVTPLLKKATLDKEEMKNFRPVSNLSFVSKILEKVVAKRLVSHIRNAGLSNSSQSAYKKFHSTETALLKIQSDILTAMDEGKVTALVLLDLSAAFDTIDHSVLLSRLENWFGVRDSALRWLTSYLSTRSQRIRVEGHLSSQADLLFGVPQGSVLGPLLFSLYTTPLSSVISKFSIPHHFYADDSQLYVSFSMRDSTAALQTLQSCLNSVQSWMQANKLKLNPEKTEFLLIGHEQQRKKYFGLFPYHLLNISTSPADKARNLGVIFDRNLNLQSHVTAVCKACFYHLRDLRRIRRHLSYDSAKALGYALVSSRLDYCNSLLHGLANKQISRLQRVQNRLARIVTKSRPFARSAPLLRSLHWLPVQFRIQFKISLLTYKTMTDGEPSYLNNMLVPLTPSRTLRSNQGPILSVPRVKTKMGSRAFAFSAPDLWNHLPLSVRSSSSIAVFKKHLKTHLFGVVFPS